MNINLIAFNENTRHFVCDDDSVVKVTGIIDYFGDDTDDIRLAFAYVVQLPNKRSVVLTRDFVNARLGKMH